MATCVPFQSQLSSIMEALVRAAVAEISKLVDEKCAFLHLEISRKQSENEMLKRKLQAMESKTALLHQGFEKYMERGVSVDHNPAAGDMKFPDLENSSAPFTVKEESPDELWISESAHNTGSSVQFTSGAPPDGPQFEKNCQLIQTDGANAQKNMDISHAYHPPHHGMGPNFTIKTEKEENQSAFGQDSCQHGTAKPPQPADANNADFSLDERNSQLWSSIMDGHEIDSSFPDFSSVVEEYSNAFSEQADAAVKAGNAHQGPPHCNGAFSSDFAKDASQMANFQPAAMSNNLHNAHLQEREGIDSQASVLFEQGGYGSQPNFQNKALSTTQRGYVCGQCGKTFGRLHQLKLHQQSHRRKRAFWCAVCGKSFMCSSHLRIHHRTHTGEKPFGCSVCGKRFTQQSSLRVHQRTHSGERPYSCSDCGKTFILMHHLKRHKIIHTYNG